jgi:hypothetical protein
MMMVSFVVLLLLEANNTLFLAPVLIEVWFLTFHQDDSRPTKQQHELMCALR